MAHYPSALVAADAARRQAATPLWLIPAADAAAVVERIVPQAKGVARLAGFRGETGQVVPFDGGVLVGLGDGSEPFALGSAASTLPEGDYAIANPMEGEAAYLAALGWGLGAYRFVRYRTEPAAPCLVLDDDLDAEALDVELSAVIRVRDLVNTPAEDMGPDALEAAVKDVASEYHAKVHVFAGEAVEEGFPLVHAVGRAAGPGKEPRVIEMRWGDPAGTPITLVGKGVCFDTGGLNIKGGTGMSLMKKDMGGAANALGLAMMLMQSGAKVNLRLLIPGVENAIAGNAFRPGDVFRSRSGQTVEISNTDAEGRLILADALAYAAEEKPAHIVSMATLTGAARVALGPDLTPVYSTDMEFRTRIVEAGEAIGDPLWPMPLWKRYHEFLSSSIADVNHAASGSFAGSITAALFLSRFVPPEIPYTHFDMYAWTPAARPGRPKGGEAMAIRALYRVLTAG